MGPISERSRNTSKYVMIRFVLKLAVFSLFCAIQIASGGPNLFFELAALAAGLALSLGFRRVSYRSAGRSTTGMRRSAFG
jgi:hypothetical protein